MAAKLRPWIELRSGRRWRAGSQLEAGIQSDALATSYLPFLAKFFGNDSVAEPLDSPDRRGYIRLPVGALAPTGTFVLPNSNARLTAVANKTTADLLGSVG
jgi:hypothetical protein